MEIIIDDKVYDIQIRHPGGNVIHYYKDVSVSHEK